jgi:poly-gamma-glutamate system protein
MGITMDKKYHLLIILFIILLFGFFILENSKVSKLSEDYEIKFEASKLTVQCFEKIKKLKKEKNIKIDTFDDINNTGMIGQDFSEITTTLGNLEAKRTSTNPNMSAVIVDMFNELGLQPGDRIAVNFSGSFPSLNIATMCAIEKMNLEPIIISSIGSSTHGANDPELTYLDMENYLYNEGLITNKSAYFSIGGMYDIGKEMNPAIKEKIVERIKGYGYKLFYDDDLIHNINARYEIYNKVDDIKCFVNVGGNDASFGDSNVMVYVDCGIITELPEKDNSTGLIQLFLRDNKPTIHILNIKSLATKYGLPFDPLPLPSVGEGGVYYTYKYNKVLATILIMIAFIILCKIYWKNKNNN